MVMAWYGGRAAGSGSMEHQGDDGVLEKVSPGPGTVGEGCHHRGARIREKS
jgi:hypothetical protein